MTLSARIDEFLSKGVPASGTPEWEAWKKACLIFGPKAPKYLLAILKDRDATEEEKYGAILGLRLFGYEAYGTGHGKDLKYWVKHPIIESMKKYIEFVGKKSGRNIRHRVSAIFYNAVIPRDHQEFFYGINVGVAIPHEDQLAADEFYREFLDDLTKGGHGGDVFLAWMGNFGREIRIPVIYCDGNAYEPKMGTSCIFVYVKPEMVAPDQRPPHPSSVTGELGSVPLPYGGKLFGAKIPKKGP